MSTGTISIPAANVTLSDGSTLAIGAGNLPVTYTSASGNAPVNSVLPAVTPVSPVVGTVETTTNGTWTNSPTSYAYQWNQGTIPISGATSANYTPVAGDVGHTLSCTVTATNASGSTPATSAATNSVVPASGGGTLTTPPGYTAAQLYRNETFASLDTSFWVPGWSGPNGALWQASPLTGTDTGSNAGGFNAEYAAVAQLGFGSNGLTVTSQPSSKYSGSYTWVSGAMTSLWTTPAGKTTYVQWLAKMPDMNNGAWPALWMLKTNGPLELDGFEGSFNQSGGPINDSTSTTVHYSGSGQHEVQVNSGADLTAAFHVYAFEHASGSFKFWLDGALLASITSNVPATGGFNVMLDLAMGQNRSWGTVSDANGHPGPYVMAIQQMQIYTK